jgi:hypothetical protein
MAKALIISSAPHQGFDPWRHGTTFLLRHSAELDEFGQHSLTDNPEEADIILFGEMGECGKFAERVRAHPYYRKFPEKCFLFDSGDLVFHLLPGIYAALTEDEYKPGHTRTGFYLYVIENAFIQHRPITGQEKYLASFVGSAVTHPIRSQFFTWSRSDIYVKDTSGRTNSTISGNDTERRERFWAEYAESVADARFSLCPRGLAASSIRLYESMKMGRGCVIVSDAWHANDGVDWDAFSVRVPEAEAQRIPQILDQLAPRAEEMGLRARQEWEKWFSEKVRFHRVVELCLDIRRHQGKPSLVRRYSHFLPILNPQNLRRYASSKRDLYKNNGKVYW